MTTRWRSSPLFSFNKIICRIWWCLHDRNSKAKNTMSTIDNDRLIEGRYRRAKINPGYIPNIHRRLPVKEMRWNPTVIIQVRSDGRAAHLRLKCLNSGTRWWATRRRSSVSCSISGAKKCRYSRCDITAARRDSATCAGFR